MVFTAMLWLYATSSMGVFSSSFRMALRRSGVMVWRSQALMVCLERSKNCAVSLRSLVSRKYSRTCSLNSAG